MQMVKGGRSQNLDEDQGGQIRRGTVNIIRVSVPTLKATMVKIVATITPTEATSMLNLQHCVAFVGKIITVRIDVGTVNLCCVLPAVVRDTNPSTIAPTRKLVKKSRPAQ